MGKAIGLHKVNRSMVIGAIRFFGSMMLRAVPVLGRCVTIVLARRTLHLVRIDTQGATSCRADGTVKHSDREDRYQNSSSSCPRSHHFNEYILRSDKNLHHFSPEKQAKNMRNELSASSCCMRIPAPANRPVASQCIESPFKENARGGWARREYSAAVGCRTLRF